MKEYFGKSVKNYRQPADKFSRLFPAIERSIEKLNLKSKVVLDLGCGDGILFSYFNKLGFEYLGVDISKDMIKEAKIKNPDGNFEVCNATKLPSKYNGKFDLVITNMLFPSIGDKETFDVIFKNVKNVLKPSGYFIISIMNPCFDGYMQKMLFNRKDIESKFVGYYTSPVRYIVNRVIDGVKFKFEDYHWQLSDYISSSKDNNFKLLDIDECKPTRDVSDIGGPTMEKMLSLTNFLVLTFKK